MGVPKFFRWISERYPNISRVINDNQIPDFDNFYLDMNGIIHTCSHINEDTCEVNVTEEEIFRNIFHYIDFLFRLIKPKKVFFMAIDGVAPRAKMNQQRARRFRAGQDRMRKLKRIAEKSGQTIEELTANHFDTNSITPGTQFMANLHEQLKYFVHVKLTTDPLWENVDVHLSGHLTPGEGEHKIMDYIRYTRLQPGYDVNTRHCLYGLDADLIMLGLVTHEIHFALLREEVKYGSKKVSKILSPEEITWHLFHTCLLRNYIDLEFRIMKEKLKFPYELESIIDDWILMAYLVGNDFIPHLPHVHIKEEALSILWDTYKKVLPTLDGYLNESGELNLTRFDTYLTEFAKFDHQRYANENDTFKNLNKLTGRKQPAMEKKSELDEDQDDAGGFNFAALEQLTVTTELPPIIEKQISLDDNLAQVTSTNERRSSDSSSSSDDDDDFSSDLDNPSDNEKKLTAAVPQTTTHNDIDKMPLIEAEFRQHKNHYYREKMNIDCTSSDQLQIFVEQYIEALQWILKYYYQGCPSWSWFYPHHYAPYLSDLKNFKDVKIVFQKEAPFKPFEQLLSVLPPTSRSLLPSVLQSLMVDAQSPLLSFYPEHFELDQNEKKQDWEAIVLLPFIDEQLLLNSIRKYYHLLDPSEQNRNQHLPSLCFRTTSNLHPIGNSLGNNPHFPALKETRASCTEFAIDHYRPDGLTFKHNHWQEKDMIIFPKFPALNVLPYKYDYKSSAVILFESRSRATTLVLNLCHRPDTDCITYNDQWDPKDQNTVPSFQITNGQLLIQRYLGKCVFVGWPHFQYGIVCAITDFRNIHLWSNIPGGSNFSYDLINNEESQDYRNYIQSPIYVADLPFEVPHDYNKSAACASYLLDETQQQLEYTKALNINQKYGNRHGITIGPIPILLYVCPLIGYRTKCSSTSDKCRPTMCFSNQALAYPLQTTVFTLPNYKDGLDQMPQTLNEHFKINDRIFGLQTPYYSSIGYVQQIDRNPNGKYSIACRLEPSDVGNQFDTHQLIPKLAEHQLRYFTAQQVADRLKTVPCVIAKITGKVNVFGPGKRRRKPIPANVGLSWKGNKPVKQLSGYTKKDDQIWLYSDAAISIISEYMLKFPEIVDEIDRNQRDDSYYEVNIWPDKNAKRELQQVRAWIKSLPTYAMSLTDGAWQTLDTPIVNELEKSTKSFYTKRAGKNSVEKPKTYSFEPERLFKPSELLGMCDPDIGTNFELYDRVVNVRLGTGVPIGTRGTVVGIMYGRTNLETYYEILFDNLPANSLDTILLGKNQQKCRVKVHSYHLLNYSHALRLRSMHQQRSVPSGNVWEQRSSEHQATARQQPSNRTSKRTTDDKQTGIKPKSAPALTTQERPNFTGIKEHNPTTTDSLSSLLTTGAPTRSFTATENASLIPPPIDNLSGQEIMSTMMTDTAPTESPVASFSTNSTPEPVFRRATHDSTQLEGPFDQSPNAIPPMRLQSFPPTSPPHVLNPDAPPYYLPSFSTESFGNMPRMSSYSFEQQSSIHTPSDFHQIPFQPFYPLDDQQFYPMMTDEFNNRASFLPYDIPPQVPHSGYFNQSMDIPISFGHEQQQQFPMQNIPFQSQNWPSTTYMHHQSPPIPPQQTASSHISNPMTRQIPPNQVPRNIPKNHK